MVLTCNNRPTEKDFLFRSNKALRDAVVYIAWGKMMSVLCYISLFFLVKLNAIGVLSLIIQILTMVAMLLVIFQAAILFLGALQESHSAVTISMFLCVFVAANDMVLGTFVAIYYIIIGHEITDYMICVTYAMLAISFFPTMFHDVFIINKYRKALFEIYENH